MLIISSSDGFVVRKIGPYLSEQKKEGHSFRHVRIITNRK
jgi:hypothetical protein